MAVYTQISKAALEDFLGAYTLGEPKHFEGIKEGVENTNYKIVTTQGHFILTLFEQRTRAEDLPYFIALMLHAATKNIPCPRPIGDRAGEILKTLAGKPAALFSQLEGNTENEPAAKQCFEVGALLAKFHRAGEDFGARRANSLSLAGWRQLIEDTGSGADKIEPNLTQDMLKELDFLEHHWPRHLPQGVIHADLFPDNVLWSGEKLTGMIDFYFSCNDLLAYDLAVCINAWCFSTDHHFHSAHATAMIEGYETVRPLNHAEHDHLGILCRGAALRFLSTRLYDLFAENPGALVKKKDPIEYLRKNRYFRNHDEFASSYA
jgi:homoserine kinase type II